MLEQPIPHGPLRWLARLPLWFYRAGLGWLLGGRFLKLTHTGRKSGQPREVVLEVVRHDPATDTYFIASGWGEKANWFRNLQHTPEAHIMVGRRQLHVRSERLAEEEATHEFRDYARRHPLAFRQLARFMVGQFLETNEASYQQLARLVPLIALRPLYPYAHEHETREKSHEC